MQNKPLIDVATLQRWLSEAKDVKILDATIDKVNQSIDADGKQAEYIPNSLFLDIEGKFSDHSNPLPHTMVDAKTFEQEARSLGINADTIVVIYDRWGIYSSPRAWWMFRYMGHPETYVLHGGLAEWKSAGLPTTNIHESNTQIKEGNFVAKPISDWLTGKNDILEKLNTDVAIIDARSKGRFEGTAPEPRAGLRSGHIPGSSNLPFDNILHGPHYQSEHDLHQVFEPILTDNQAIFTCGSGISAAILALAAYQIGHENISIYDGSWSEWGANDNLPVA
ncbi:sulfurtransferase [Sphingobacterium corticis]|uniref:Sulfurtransferase n=1 Tax=Sphingobacterium corticis TaxID=1812823 RepID=A0ABW5NM48_9SPHI